MCNPRTGQNVKKVTIIRQGNRIAVSPTTKRIKRLLVPKLRIRTNVYGELVPELLELFTYDQYGHLCCLYGLSSRIAETLIANGYKVQMADLSNSDQSIFEPQWQNLVRSGLKLRAFQDEILSAFFSYDHGRIDAPPGLGKTTIAVIIALVCPKAKIHFVCKELAVVKSRALPEFRQYLPSVGMIGDGEYQPHARVLLVGADSLHRAPRDADIVLVDECFPGDVELLTEKGFIRFDALPKTLKVAEYESGEIRFVKPLRYVKRQYKGELVRLQSQRLCDLAMTPNHELLLSYEQGTRKETAERVKFNCLKRMYVAGRSQGEERDLTVFERLMIATQADGSDHSCNNTFSSLTFSFSKARKIKRFLALMREGEFDWSEVKGDATPRNDKTKKRRRFLVKQLSNVSKEVWKYFDLGTMGSGLARKIIEEMAEWDGYRNPAQQQQRYFSSCDERAVDFYQAVAILAGYKTNKTVQRDERSEAFNDVFRLFINVETDSIGCQAIEKSTTDHDGLVYCVTVPSGNIVVRRNGKPLVVGNCHRAGAPAFSELLVRYKNARMWGLSASHDMRMDNRNLVVEALTGPLRYKVSYKAGVKAGVIVPIQVKWTRVSMQVNPVEGEENNVERKREGIWCNDVRNEKIARDARRYDADTQVLITCETIDHAIRLKKLLPEFTLVYSAQGLDWKRRAKYVKKGLLHMNEKVMTPWRRSTLTKAFERGELKKVIVTTVWNAGVSMNHLEVLIRADGGASQINDVQIPGRVSRINKQGKKVGILHDYVDSFDFKFLNRSVSRYKSYRRQKWTQTIPKSTVPLLTKRHTRRTGGDV